MTSKSNPSEDEPLIFKNYDSTLRQFFAEMYLNPELSDGMLICEDRRFRVHKFLLSASSSFFNNMFKKSSNLLISNIQHRILKKVLEYIYLGQVKLTAKQVPLFIDATKKLSVAIGNQNDGMKNISMNDGPTITRSQSQDCHSGKIINQSIGIQFKFIYNLLHS